MDKRRRDGCYLHLGGENIGADIRFELRLPSAMLGVKASKVLLSGKIVGMNKTGARHGQGIDCRINRLKLER